MHLQNHVVSEGADVKLRGVQAYGVCGLILTFGFCKDNYPLLSSHMDEGSLFATRTACLA